MSKDYSIDDILAEVANKRGGSTSKDADIDDILSKKPTVRVNDDALPLGVTEILNMPIKPIAAPISEPEPAPLVPEPIPEKPKKQKPEKPVKIEKPKPEKPVKTEKPEKLKPEKSEKPIKAEKPKPPVIKDLSMTEELWDKPPTAKTLKREKRKEKQGEVFFKKAAVPPKLVIDEAPPPVPEPTPPPDGGTPVVGDAVPSVPLNEPLNKGAAISIGGDSDSEFEFPRLEITQVLEKLKPAPIDEALKKRDEALLERDMALEQPLEQIDALNPYDMLEPASDENNDSNGENNEKFVSQLSGDTKGIADGDLKELAEKSIITSNEPTAEVVKTYIPSNAPPPDLITASILEASSGDTPPATAGHLNEKARRSNTALIESLNKALKERRDSDVDAYRTLTDVGDGAPGVPQDSPPPVTHGLNIDYKKQVLTDTSLALTEHQPQLIEQKMKELKGKRKRKIRDFVLEDIEGEEQGEMTADDDSEYEDLDTAGQIWSDLCATHKDLRFRFIILFVITVFACIVAVGNDLGIMNANILGINMYFLDKIYEPKGFLYLNLFLGIIGVLTCTSVVKRGFAKLFTGKADCDSLCAVPAVASVLCVVPMLNATGYLQKGNVNIFVAAGLAGLLFNTTGKLMMMARAKRNFSFISGDNPKYFAELIRDEQVARAFTKGVMHELPVLCTMRKTEFLADFLKNSYCDDKADQLCRYLVPAAFAAALTVGLGSLILPYENTQLGGNIFWALTAATATLCALSPLSIMFLVNNPLLRASKALAKNDAVVLGYNSAERFSKTNSVLIDAQALFPAGSVDFRNLKRCQQPNSLAGFAIDDAIITAASLAIKSGSILTSMFYDMIAGKSEMLYPIDNCIYEVNMGISGWMGNKRVMLGNRDQMKHHGIKVPDQKKEDEYSKKFGEVVYLASGGETVAMFFLKIVPNPQIRRSLQALQRQGTSIIVRTRDSLVTAHSLAEAYGLKPENLRIIPFDLHAKFDDCTKYSSRGNGNVACSGTFSSFASALITAKKIMHSIILSSSAVFIGLFLAVILSVIFTIFGGGAVFSSTGILIYNGFFFLMMLAMQGVRKY